jgi:hypothetical protein
MVEAINPKVTVFIGFGAADLFGKGTVLLRDGKMVLVRSATAGGHGAFAIPHLTGYHRITLAHRQQIADYLKMRVAKNV